MDDYLSKPIQLDALRAALRGDGAAPEPEEVPIEQILDPERLQTLAGIGQDGFLGKLIDIYLTSAEAELETLGTALEKGDLDAVAATAHSLKGSSLNLGAQRITRACRRLEELATEGDLKQARHYLGELAARIDEARPVLEERRDAETVTDA